MAIQLLQVILTFGLLTVNDQFKTYVLISGPDCEKEYDGCLANPCSLNRTCIKLSPKEQKLLGRSFNCSACPDGYSVHGITECLGRVL